MSASNGYTKAADIFAKPFKRQYKDVSIKNLGKFRVRSLNTSERVKLETHCQENDSALASICIAHCVDADGNLIFTRADESKLMGRDWNAIAALAASCQWDEEASEQDAVKN